jgi:hypothetical protein
LNDHSGKVGSDVVTTPYQSGYLDFMPFSDQIKVQSGPPRTSLLDDLLFYVCNHSNALDLSDPASLRLFVNKIVASHYLKLAEFLQHNIEVIQWILSGRQDLTEFHPTTAEDLWSDVQAWERRIGEYTDDLEAIMLQLGISQETSKPCQVSSWKDSAVDFQSLLLRFQEIGRRVRGLNEAITALAGLAGNRAMSRTAELSLQEAERASREAKSVKALTILGIVFIPLSFSASILSMADTFQPGGEMFWIYFVLAFPLLVVVVSVYVVMELGYLNGGTTWSLKTVVANARQKFA